jgi:hypothetical protein
MQQRTLLTHDDSSPRTPSTSADPPIFGWADPPIRRGPHGVIPGTCRTRVPLYGPEGDAHNVLDERKH